MGPKRPPPNKPLQADLQEDDGIRLSSSSDHWITDTPLSRIAKALQVPLATLYQLPNSAGAVSQPTEQTADRGDHSGECRALIHAFLRISDPEERRRVLAIVQASAERT